MNGNTYKELKSLLQQAYKLSEEVVIEEATLLLKKYKDIVQFDCCMGIAFFSKRNKNHTITVGNWRGFQIEDERFRDFANYFIEFDKVFKMTGSNITIIKKHDNTIQVIR